MQQLWVEMGREERRIHKCCCAPYWPSWFLRTSAKECESLKFLFVLNYIPFFLFLKTHFNEGVVFHSGDYQNILIIFLLVYNFDGINESIIYIIIKHFLCFKFFFNLVFTSWITGLEYEYANDSWYILQIASQKSCANKHSHQQCLRVSVPRHHHQQTNVLRWSVPFCYAKKGFFIEV